MCGLEMAFRVGFEALADSFDELVLLFADDTAQEIIAAAPSETRCRDDGSRAPSSSLGATAIEVTGQAPRNDLGQNGCRCLLLSGQSRSPCDRPSSRHA